MDKLRNTIFAALLLVAGLTIPIRAKMATTNEALTVANNWVRMIIQEKGGWGDANTASVEDIQEFKRGQRTIGYFCNVKPRGCIVISLRRELAPVKAYSVRCNLDAESEEGMADLIKGRMERILDTIEQLVGPVQTARTEDVSKILEIDYRNAWAELEGDISTVEWGLSDKGDIGTTNYQEGDILLTTDWHQGDPFNQDCPAPPGDDDCTAARCLVGCVATAGAQIMRYWYWPPYGEGSPPYNDTYDWTNMPNTVIVTSPAEMRNAVAELCREIGIAVSMNYCGDDDDGCQSGAQTYDMEDVYEDHYYYSTLCSQRDRSSYSALDWFDLMKIDLNENRPVHYRILRHSIVGDGWQEIGGGPTPQYHMNYGWSGTGDDIWYTLDALNQSGGGTISDEYMLVNILPVTSVKHTIIGTYTRNSFNYRYFDQDASGNTAFFEAGQNLQFMPNIVVTSNGTGTINFKGNSRFFTRGDTSIGIRTDSGGISLYPGGQMTLY